MKQILQDLSFAEVEQLMAELGEQKYRAGQLYRGLMRGKKIADITELSAALKQKLLQRFEDEPVRIAGVNLLRSNTSSFYSFFNYNRT